MAIITLTDTLLQRLKADDGRIVRDRILVGFCKRLYKFRRSRRVDKRSASAIVVNRWMRYAYLPYDYIGIFVISLSIISLECFPGDCRVRKDCETELIPTNNLL